MNKVQSLISGLLGALIVLVISLVLESRLGYTWTTFAGVLMTGVVASFLLDDLAFVFRHPALVGCWFGYPLRCKAYLYVLWSFVNTPWEWPVVIGALIVNFCDFIGLFTITAIRFAEHLNWVDPRVIAPVPHRRVQQLRNDDRFYGDDEFRPPRSMADLMHEFRAQASPVKVRHVEDQKYIVSSIGQLKSGDGWNVLVDRDVERRPLRPVVARQYPCSFQRIKKLYRKSRAIVCREYNLPPDVRLERISSRRVSKERKMWSASVNRERDLKEFQRQALSYEMSFMVKLVEDLSMMMYHMSRPGRVAKIAAIMGFVKMRLSGSLVEEMQSELSKLVPSGWQAQAEPIGEDDWTATMRGFVDKYDVVKGAPFFKKVFRFLSLAIGLSIFSKLGGGATVAKLIPMDSEVAKIGANAPDFIHAIMDLVVFFCERGQQCFRSGSLEPIFHSGDRYTEWCKDAKDLKDKSQFLSNPAVVGMDPFEYHERLNHTIEKGEAIVKHTRATGYFYRKLVDSLLADLKLIKADVLTKRYCQSERPAPFGVLVHGKSSVAKSNFSYMLFQLYGKIRGLRTDDVYRYVRNPMEDFWTNFESFMWCVHMDDIARLKPAKAPQGDPTMNETLSVMNNVPFVPSQASLEDKGRTPVRPELVIATTNIEHMNVNAYFAEPFAIQRRFPWIINIRPKPEYAKGDMIDSARLPETQPGELPNFWIITVRVVHQPETPGYPGTIKDHCQFTEINDFVEWYGQEIRKHHGIQLKADRSNQVVRDIELCSITCRPKESCDCPCCIKLEPQALPEIVHRTFFVICAAVEHWYYWVVAYCTLTILFYTSLYITVALWGAAGFVLVMMRQMMVSASMKWAIAKRSMYYLGQRVKARLQTNQVLLAMAAGLVGCAATYAFVRRMYTLSLEAQGTTASALGGTRPVPVGDERPNPWYKENFVLHPRDIAPAACGYKAMDPVALDQLIGANCFSIMVLQSDGKAIPVKMLGLEGDLFVTVNHAFPESKHRVEVRGQPDQISGGHSFTISESGLYRFPERDVVFLRIPSMPRVRKISPLFAEIPVRGGTYVGRYIMRQDDHNLFINPVEKIEPQGVIESEFGRQESFMCVARTRTENGMCGAPLVADTYFGPMIVGIHNFGDKKGTNRAVSTALTVEDIRRARQHFKVMISAAEIELSSEERKVSVGELNPKSPFRWIPQGLALVYGSLDLPRATMRSMVRESPICRSVMDTMGYAIEYGRPFVRGWEPLRNALVDIVDKPLLADPDIVDRVKRERVVDILRKLPVSELQIIEKYDVFTAVNGAAGVSYVDKINRNTSAGFPFNCRKSLFMTELPAEDGLSNPVEFNPEIEKRVAWMIERYKNGQMANPVFQACLKDEALPFEKIDAKKTRVFTGGPVDFTIVGRMYLLSFVRLVQRNRYAFSCAVGTVAQSREWHDMRTFLVQHGEDRIIAGDYSRFDRSVDPIWQSAAWYVIKAVVLIARAYTLGIVSAIEVQGVTVESLITLLDRVYECPEMQEFILVLEGIEADTLHPLVNFFGDLCRLFGIIPSGHFLTVILNSIVNELYLRYSFEVLREGPQVFVDCVALQTYGDDNIMGVSVLVPWFNHTAISGVLASIGLKYTMADKGAESVPYIHIDRASFLKRKWVMDEDFGFYVCPLDRSSIGKMLTVWTYSKTICPQAQAVAVISTAGREYAWYGRKEFERRAAELKTVVRECHLESYVEESTFPSFDSLVEDFERNSGGLKAGA